MAVNEDAPCHCAGGGLDPSLFQKYPGEREGLAPRWLGGSASGMAHMARHTSIYSLT
jgi:hypothetical protein